MPTSCWFTIRPAEREFIDEGYGTTRRQIAWNDFVIVGPSSDPREYRRRQGRRGGVEGDRAGARGVRSRGDRSDINVAELRLWRVAGRTSEALTPEKWYRDIDGGMGQALDAASAMNAYTLPTARTWLGFDNKGPLIIAVEGDPQLLNRYDVIELNPKKHGRPRLAEAKVLPTGWFRRRASRHRRLQVNGEKLFNASAASPE